MILEKNKLVIAFIAFFCYQIVNFLYFPLSTRFPDEQRFLNEAIVFANTGEFWIQDFRAWEMPLTAIIYGTLYKLFTNIEYTIIAIRILQSLMLILQGYLIYEISKIIFKDKSVAFLSFIIVLFYPFFIFYQALLLSETAFITIFIISFYFLYKWYESDFHLNSYFLLTNVFFTLSLYSKGTLSILPPILITLFYFINKYKIKKAITIFLLSTIVYCLIMSLWWVRNAYIFNQFVPFTTSSGMNLYLGANKHNKNASVTWAKDTDREFVEKANTITDEIERNRVFKEKAKEFILENPERYVEFMWLKFKRFYSFTFNFPTYDTILYNTISIMSYGVVIVFALLSFILHIKRWREFSAIYIVILYFTLLHIIFIASLRYRLPLEPLFIILASYSLIYYKNKLVRYK